MPSFLLLTGKSVACTSSFTYTYTGNTVQFTNTSIAPITATYQWYFGDGSSSADTNPIHDYIYPGNYYACLVVSDTASGCYEYFCDSVELPNSCTSNFTDSLIGNTYYFTDNSSGSPTQWNWNFGDGATANTANPSHSFAAIGTYWVCLTISDSGNACYSTSCQIIHVLIDSSQQCIACFTKHTGSDSVLFYDCSLSVNQITQWFWDLGDGSSSTLQNPVHTYPGLGIYDVCLTIEDTAGCSHTYCDTVRLIFTNCSAAFTDSSNGSSVQFTDQSNAGTHTDVWTFGDGTSSTQTNPSHIYTSNGNYTVCLTIDDSAFCHSYSCQQISVGGGGVLCNADFVLVPDSFQQGLYHGYNLATGNNLTYFWSWGDGSTSTGQYPSHQYADSSFYYICMGIHDSISGCVDSFCANYLIQKLQRPMGMHKIIFVNTTGVAPLNHDQEIQWSIFPNPASNNIRIQTNANKIERIRIMDVSGRVMKQIFSYDGDFISLAVLPQGAYIVRILIEGAWSSKLLIKQ
ncbi:MAG TPA: PKD domain-containing protein [Chitinophagales bacterium]|nr:PKD domain-containing protein [Chitinophagales bacterium]